MKYFPSFYKGFSIFFIENGILEMRKNAILKYKMEYEFDVATYFFQRYFSMLFQYFDVKPCELLIFIQICADVLV